MADKELVMTAGFKIHGSWFTDLLREKVAEGSWRSAYDLIMDAFDEFSRDDAIAVLQGKLRFEGVNDFDLVEEPPEVEAEVQEALDYRYRRCFLFRGTVYQVYGVVDIVCELDNTWACSPESQLYFSRKNARAAYEASYLDCLTMIASTGRTRKEQAYVRGCHYLQGSEDILIATGEHSVACRPICTSEALPLWVKFPKLEGQELYAFLNEAAERVRSISREVVDDYLARTSSPRVERPRVGYKSEEEHEEEVRREEEKIAQMRDAIRSRADAEGEAGWMTVTEMVEGRNETLRIPLTPLKMFVYSVALAWHLIPEDYQTVCHSGMKMMNDSAYHSDAWLGAGLDLDKAYDMDSVEYKLFYSAVYQLQEELLKFKFAVLSKGPYASGTVIHDVSEAGEGKILVVKNAAAEYAEAAAKCEGVICENGSTLTHLVTVMRESALPVMRGENALTLFPVGSKIAMYPESGDIKFRLI